MNRTDDSETAPSTPGMTTSKSSKSSSFQSVNSEDGGALEDISHFEDIGLDDHSGPAQNGPHHPPLHSYRLTSPTTSSGRTLASSKRAPTQKLSNPNLRSTLHTSNPRSTSLTVLTDPGRPTSPRRSPSSHSTNSLPLGGRRRSPSPNVALDPKNPTLPSRPRRGSWQSNKRKSFAELEHECDEDEGDDIPDGLILDNVPMSPRPQNERPPSRQPSLSPSPSRASKERSKERVRSVGNGTPAVAQAQGSLKSPTWKYDASSAERPPIHPTKSRAHSWNAALAHLNAEAKALTEKLEEHADEEEERSRRPSNAGRPNTWNSMQRSSEYSHGKKERVKSTPELPPLRKTNVMIDPLPVSKEKEAVLSRTRPSWLPPKNPAEERRHLKEYQKMMAASARADERREAARRSKTELKDTIADDYMQTWEQDIIPRWNDAIRERKTRELWWAGVPPRSRGVVWLQAIGNELGLSEASFQTALERARDVESRFAGDKASAEDVRVVQWFQQIRKDTSEHAWKELRVFDHEGPLHDNLIDVLIAYSMYRSDIGYVSGSNTIAALLLLNLPSPAATFIALANVLNRPLPLAFYTSDVGAQASVYNLVLDTLSRKSAQLFEHLTRGIHGADPARYLQDLFSTIFTGHLAVDEAARLWDVYVFEGDALLVRAATAILLRKEMTLLGCNAVEDVKMVLGQRDGPDGRKSPVVTQVGAENKFIADVREAGKT